MPIQRVITAYHTHIEVFPYEAGEVKRIEDMYSIFDPVFYKMNPIAYYIANDTLYLPRGTNLHMLENIFGTTPIISTESDPVQGIKLNRTIEPKSEIQAEAVEFLCSEGRFAKGLGYSQLSLNLEPGDGKTIATIMAITDHYRCKTIVILHQTKLKNQWKNEFLKATDIEEDRIYDIVGSAGMMNIIDGNIDADIFIVNHQTIHQFAATHGWNLVREFFQKINVGLKVYDEAHKYFSNICMIDFFSNTKKTIYLTATFRRNGIKEQTMFKRAFSNTYRFGEETSNYEGKRKHIIYYYCLLNSNPPPIIVSRMYNKFSISPFKYINYELSDGNYQFRTALKQVLLQVQNLRGKILIISPKKDSSEYLASFARMILPTKTSSVINSDRTREENEEATKADIISSTLKSLGTGIDIRGLRVIINLEPFSSEINMTQLKGRLREFSKTDDTFFFDLVDTGIKRVQEMGDKRFNSMKKYAKEIKIVTL